MSTGNFILREEEKAREGRGMFSAEWKKERVEEIRATSTEDLRMILEEEGEMLEEERQSDRYKAYREWIQREILLRELHEEMF